MDHTAKKAAKRKLARISKRLGVPQAEAAAALGISERTLRNWTRDVKRLKAAPIA